jgi:hypothetical protein
MHRFIYLVGLITCLSTLGSCDVGGDGEEGSCDDGGACDAGAGGGAPDGSAGGGGSAGDSDGGGSGEGGDDGGGSGEGGSGGTSRDSGFDPDGPDICAESVPATVVTPNVIIIIDQSATMDTAFTGADDRWDALRTALIGDDGLIKNLQASVRFGVVLYSGSYHAPECPLLMVAPAKASSPGVVNVKLDAYEDIKAVYGDAGTVGETPTGDSIDAVLDQIDGTEIATGDDPTIFILSTDGEPDRCEQLDPDGTSGARAEAVAAIRRAYDDYGIKTFVIAVAKEAELSQEHVNDLANAGQGVDADPGELVSESFRVNSTDDLGDTLEAIVGGHLTCVIDLEGRVTSIRDGCVSARVTLNGEDVPCDGENGWMLINDHQMELFGTYCDELMNNPDSEVEAVFPCEVIVVE